MNEQIEKLADRADEYADQTVHYYMGQFDGLTWEGKTKQTRDKKFAELIVKECMSLVSEPGPDMNDTERGILAQIKQHFGVEE